MKKLHSAEVIPTARRQQMACGQALARNESKVGKYSSEAARIKQISAAIRTK